MLVDAWKRRARELKSWTLALALVYRDPRVPWYARAVALLVVGYALSPIDLVPDFIPILGYLDDLILIPLGIALAVRLIPAPVLQECRERADRQLAPGRRTAWTAAVVIVGIWALGATLVGLALARALHWW